MASSLISNIVHVLFDSVLAMEDEGIVAIFEALVASGLTGFLGCSIVIYEGSLMEFFQHGSVRDGMVVSTIQGKTVEITEEVFTGTFELPTDGLTDLNEVPKDLVFYARSIFSFSGEQVSTSCKKREMKIEFRLLSDILEKSIFVKVGSFDAVTHEIFLMMAAINGGIQINWSREFVAREADRMVESGSDTDEEIVTDKVIETDAGETADGEQTVPRSDEKEKDAESGASEERVVAKKNAEFLCKKPTDEELMTIDDLLMQISDDMMLPSVTAAEFTKIKFCLSVKINEVQDKDCYVNKLQDVFDFFHSFSLSQILDLESVTEIAAKEKHMLSWEETNSLETAVKRRVYIIVKYREMMLRKFLESHRKYFEPGQPWIAMASQIIDLLSVSHRKSLKALLAQKKEDGLIWERPCSSSLFDDSVDGGGAVLAQFYSLAKSTCWVRPMVLIDGVWTPLQGNDYWRSSCRLSFFVTKRQLPERAIEDSFVPHCYFIKPDQYLGASQSIIKTWGMFIVCTYIILYSMFGCLRPVGSVNSCRDIVVKSSVVEFFEKVPSGFFDVLHQESFDDLRASISRIIVNQSNESRRQGDTHDEVLVKIKNLERTLLDILSTKSSFPKPDSKYLADVLKEAKEQKAIIEEMDERLATVRSELLDFRVKAQENHNTLSTQLGFLVDYINRGGNDKRGNIIAAAVLNRRLMIRVDPVGEVRAEVVVLVEVVGEEMIEVDLQRKDIVVVVMVDLVLVV
ncbi:hypothetical protein F511_04278 [Dorcoceras hygrometricum]|uniref:Uncharacterized protein n=1 Tax=Dorcoceras hygrometricum TaxID=472368 RepID=A0A2Z7BVE7_9LAMI|nr:hypothetical protein F511_04278 [Dorcoceras hygrometricum]